MPTLNDEGPLINTVKVITREGRREEGKKGRSESGLDQYGADKATSSTFWHCVRSGVVSEGVHGRLIVVIGRIQIRMGLAVSAVRI